MGLEQIFIEVVNEKMIVIQKLEQEKQELKKENAELSEKLKNIEKILRECAVNDGTRVD